ncbi:BrnA antitoxin family protein [Burkholderia oklahomensis]|nr:BrnA antitoxin family protein [Burkholderia oklahomensis]AJX33984.1 hypothetical protein BG90_4765 [Burkholderia oklahomensis C6786]AJX34544.1 hypothetical protein BG90_4750 [Burkholderia oklahomensis C6786]AOI38786.1 hypothetical protein WG70_03520 [Burkholderia oklahomensis EO147]AOI48484.1 hypothetical protein WI23_21695 [Burkholderia oklahomensis C6786]AOI48492.1 hypothetical protein WI23_21760 [Burkholderia oklahomensis C6786]
MSSKREIVMPTDEADAAIIRGIAADPDTFDVPAEDFAKMTRGGKRGRPPHEVPKVQLTVRYDVDIVDAFKATGEGWQTRMNDALREWLREHQPV